MAATKVLAIEGIAYAGKSMLTGYLLYNFGSEREQIDAHGFDFYDEVPAIYEEKELPMTFETKTGQFLIEETNTPDIAIWIASAGASDGVESSEALVARLDVKNSERLQPKEKLIILVGHMDFLSWFKQYFDQITESFINLNYGTTPTYIAPISALRGTNVLQTPTGSPWVDRLSSKKYPGTAIVSNQTLMQLLCGSAYDIDRCEKKEEPAEKEKDSSCCVIL